MSKELTPLKALKSITEYLTGDYRDCFEELSIIENALKENEYLKADLLGLSQELFVKNKALNIIKNKYKIVSSDIGMCNSKENIKYNLVIERLTQKEYDLLKEILL